MALNKGDLVELVAEKTKMSKKAANDAVSATFEAIAESLAKGDKVSLVGFGSFEVKTRAAREGRNPATGEKTTFAASNKPVFKAGKGLKDMVNA